MFKLTIENLASDEQQARWLPDVYKLKMVGGYAQTELGHGSNVAGIETTATFDKSTDQFIIHSPTVTSSKFWPGTLGLYANHAIVYARLRIEDQDYGVQPFLVPIRDYDTHKHLPGIKTGDIGPKLGWGSSDNGWGIFNQVRIPRTNMLSRFSEVDKEGNFQVTGDLRVLYSIMVNIRSSIIYAAGKELIRGLKIAVRYSVCRRQFSTQVGTKVERKILDYQS